MYILKYIYSGKLWKIQKHDWIDEFVYSLRSRMNCAAPLKKNRVVADFSPCVGRSAVHARPMTRRDAPEVMEIEATAHARRRHALANRRARRHLAPESLRAVSLSRLACESCRCRRLRCCCCCWWWWYDAIVIVAVVVAEEDNDDNDGDDALFFVKMLLLLSLLLSLLLLLLMMMIAASIGAHVDGR